MSTDLSILEIEDVSRAIAAAQLPDGVGVVAVDAPGTPEHESFVVGSFAGGHWSIYLASGHGVEQVQEVVVFTRLQTLAALVRQIEAAALRLEERARVARSRMN